MTMATSPVQNDKESILYILRLHPEYHIVTVQKLDGSNTSFDNYFQILFSICLPNWKEITSSGSRPSMCRNVYLEHTIIHPRILIQQILFKIKSIWPKPLTLPRKIHVLQRRPEQLRLRSPETSQSRRRCIYKIIADHQNWVCLKITIERSTVP